MLQSKQLQYQYPDGAAFQFPDLSCEMGSHWLILGPSGSGKSTLLHLLAALLPPSGGQLSLNGTEYGQLNARAGDRFRGQHIGMIFQRSYFVASLTVAENLALAQSLAGQKVDKKANLALLEELGIAQHANRSPHQLSVGEQQRASIARGLVNRPKLLLADEPTAALDAQNASTVSRLLRERAATLKSILLIVTHDERLRSDFENVIHIS
ncbi:MAG: ATP-binding cassette domain-containing protein [Bacteroidota bacterium]